MYKIITKNILPAVVLAVGISGSVFANSFQVDLSFFDEPKTGTTSKLTPTQVRHHANLDRALRAYQQNQFSRAAKLLTSPANLGHTSAQFMLATLYMNGQGVKQDKERALFWYKQAAHQGHTAAQHNLGVMYISAPGITTDHREAFKWFTLAAQQGDGDSQFSLGIMYSEGLGVDRNLALAYQWHTRAAQNGNLLAVQWLQRQIRFSQEQ